MVEALPPSPKVARRALLDSARRTTVRLAYKSVTRVGVDWHRVAPDQSSKHMCGSEELGLVTRNGADQAATSGAVRQRILQYGHLYRIAESSLEPNWRYFSNRCA